MTDTFIDPSLEGHAPMETEGTDLLTQMRVWFEQIQSIENAIHQGEARLDIGELSARVKHLSLAVGLTISELDADLQRLSRQPGASSEVDQATGLPNREGFIAELGRSRFLGAPAKAAPVGLLLAIRLEAWRGATANRDPVTQDALIKALLARFREIQWTGALLGRSSEDTYLAWLPVNAADAEAGMEALLARIKQLEPAITAGTVSAPTRPRIGMCFVPNDGSDPGLLATAAEMACAVAVRMAQTKPVRYNLSLIRESEARKQLETDLAEAIRENGLRLHYQPLISPKEPRLRKAEGLIRWHHPTQGLIPPDALIPLAEQSDLIIGLTDWVLREAATQVKQWRETLHPDFQISVNMPSAYLKLCVREPGLMLERLQALQLPPGAMVLEFTEGVLLEVTTELLQVITLLRMLGFQISLDDFGLGYSSFGQIDKLELDFLKLDKTFVEGLGVRTERGTICEAIVSMAHRLGIQVVAEGVETREQADKLIAMQADYLQGYLYSQAVSAQDLTTWAAASHPA